jgi:glycosyltransferase involved in cell wall biosynthesis
MVHRVDGPIGVYRGFDDGTDERIAAINRLADATVFQSAYSLAKHRELGYELRDPHVVPNAVDPAIFNADGRVAFDRDRPLRLIASSWSDNPRKGGPTYRWLEERLDPERATFTFVGRTAEPLRGAVAPRASRELAELLRSHDVFVTASEHDPCSNAVLEALACGLPVLYLQSGGHPELVGDAGLGFGAREELPELIERLAGEYEERQARISVPSLADVAGRYLDVLGIDAR